MSALPPFAEVRVSADNRMLEPRDGRSAVRLAPCDVSNPRWENCPTDWAIRIDLAYEPKLERITSHEWVMSGDAMEGDYKLSERESSTEALLDLWKSRPR